MTGNTRLSVAGTTVIPPPGLLALASWCAVKITIKSGIVRGASGSQRWSGPKRSSWPQASRLLSPLTPLLFMGEEYGETSPFQYFVSHGDPDLVEAVRKGRTEEFSSFGWAEEVPDPQAESTFTTSRLNHSLKQREPHRTLLCFYKHLIRFRNDHALSQRENFTVQELGDNVLLLLFGLNPRSGQKHQSLAAVFHFGDAPRTAGLALPGTWQLHMESSDAAWLGPGASLPQMLRSSAANEITLQPWSFAVWKETMED